MTRAIGRCLVLIALLSPALARAQTERDSLRSAGPVAVVVEVMGSADVPAAGVTDVALKRAVERWLEQGKIAVDNAGKSQLSVSVNTIRSSVGVYATCVRVEFRQEVWVLQNRQEVLAPTWQRDSVGVRGPDRLMAIGDLVMQYVGEFVQDYTAVNP